MKKENTNLPRTRNTNSAQDVNMLTQGHFKAPGLPRQGTDSQRHTGTGIPLSLRGTKQSRVRHTEGNIELHGILKILNKLYPDPACALHYKKPWELLVAVILSAQCTDKKVNEVTKELFKKYVTLADYVSAKPAEFEKDIHATGFYRAKTKNILAAANVLKDNFEGKIPTTMSEMITIPGVGRKTANVVLGELYGVAEGIAVDTHVIRLSHLFGLTKHTDATKIEQDLIQIVHQKDWVRFSHMLILYSREYCTARCKHTDCPLKEFVKCVRV